MNIFVRWFETVLEKEFPPEVNLFGLELFDSGNAKWQIGCYGVGENRLHQIIHFSTEEMTLTFQKMATRDEIRSNIRDEIRTYARTGKYAERLQAFDLICVGFWDDDIPCVAYQKP